MSLRIALLLAAFGVSSTCTALESDVQRQILQREQSQAELRLKMQQQQERGLNPPQSPSADVQRRMLERDQHQRLQQFQERQAREQATPAAAGDAQRDIERERRAQTTAEELNRLERERQLESERARDPQP
jgi:hypothetical protein